MLTDPKLRSQVDALWDKFWTGGLSNPLDASEQCAGVVARVEVLRELQSATGEELSALLPSVLDRAFKGEL